MNKPTIKSVMEEFDELFPEGLIVNGRVGSEKIKRFWESEINSLLDSIPRKDKDVDKRIKEIRE